MRKDNEYIYVPHDVNSPNLTFHKDALDHFDTIFSSGYLCTEELRKREEMYHLPKKNIIPWGSGVIDNMIQSYEKMEKRNKTAKEILIAPSWQKDNILSSCIEEILDSLDGLGYNIIVRPHPQFVRHEAGWSNCARNTKWIPAAIWNCRRIFPPTIPYTKRIW